MAGTLHCCLVAAMNILVELPLEEEPGTVKENLIEL
jgi:hypothetical protein